MKRSEVSELIMRVAMNELVSAEPGKSGWNTKESKPPPHPFGKVGVRELLLPPAHPTKSRVQPSAAAANPILLFRISVVWFLPRKLRISGRFIPFGSQKGCYLNSQTLKSGFVCCQFFPEDSIEPDGEQERVTTHSNSEFIILEHDFLEPAV